MRKSNKRAIALMVGDIHLSHSPPLSRLGESDWYKAQAGPIRQLCELVDRDDMPDLVLCAGDIFHKWTGPLDLLAFAIDELPTLHAVAGQHDLPYHREDDRQRSYFGLLEKTRNIQYIPAIERLGRCTPGYVVRFYGVSWGGEIPKILPKQKYDDRKYIEVVVVHGFVYKNQATAFPGVGAESSVLSWRKRLKGFDVAIFGDNHHHFTCTAARPHIYNCGCFIRRRSCEMNYKPRVGILYEDGSFGTHLLSTEGEKMEKVSSSFNLTEARDGIVSVIEALRGLGYDDLDFVAALNQAVSGSDSRLVRKSVRRAVREIVNAQIK